MTIPVYADVLFFINFSMDFLSLYLTAKLLHRPVRTLPLAAGAALGALYAIWTLYLRVGNVAVTILNLAASAVLVGVAFFPLRRFSAFLRETAVFYGVSFLLGGTMTALYNLCNSFLFSDRLQLFGNAATVETELSFGGFALLAGASAGISLLFGRFFTRSRAKKTVPAEITVGTRRVTLTLLVDSGNLLCDPTSGRPVLVCARRAVAPLFFGGLAAFFAEPTAARIALLRGDAARRIRAIPMQGAGGDGLLFAFRPDKIVVEGRAVQALIAVELREAYGGADGLLPPVLLT